MAETDQFSPESGGGTFPFKVGEEDFGFNGGFTEGKFTGMIRGADGKDFAGIVEDLGNGRYRIEDWESGRMFEPPSEQMVLPAADVAPGLEDAAAVAAMEAAPVEQAAAAGPTPEEVAEDIERTRLGMEPPPVEEEKRVVEEPAATEPIFQPSAPASELQPEPASMPEPSPAAMPESAPQPETAPSATGAVKEFDDRLAEAKTAAEALELFEEKLNALEEGATQESENLADLLEEQGALRREFNAVSKVADRKLSSSQLKDEISRAERQHILNARKRKQEIQIRLDELGGEDGELSKAKRLAPDNKLVEARRLRRIHELRAEAEKWRHVADNPNLITRYNRLRDSIVQVETNQLLPSSVRQMIAKELRGSIQQAEEQLPKSYPEMAGAVEGRRRGKDIALDTFEENFVYNRVAQQLYAELAGQPQAAAEAVAEPVVTEPVVETAVESVVEGPVEAVAEEAPQPETEPSPVAMEDNPAEVVLPPMPEEEASAPEPMETPMPGEVVVDAAEQAMVSGMPVGAPMPEEPSVAEKTGTVAGDAQKGIGQFTEGLSASFEDKAREYADRISTGEDPTTMGVPDALRARVNELVVQGRVTAPTEAPVQPEIAGETPEQKFERRKQGFAGALAELDRARGDASGTEGEQKVRLAEAYNQVIGAAMEFMNEGDGAREVVRGFLAGALGTSGGRKLTEVAVRSRMDEAGVTGAPVGEKKKKLEQAGLLGLLELLLELGMSFTDKTIGAVVSEVQSATGAGR